MKKVYIKPKCTIEEVSLEPILLSTSSMGGNEKPGGPDEFNANDRRGTWGNLWAQAYSS